jgi:hypothetical protein
MRSLPGGAPFCQRDRLFSTSVRRLDLLCGRLLTDGSRPRVLAVPAYLPRDLRQQALELLATDPSAEQIAMFLGPDPYPYVLNSDRQELCYSELTLDVPDVGPAWQRLNGAGAGGGAGRLRGEQAARADRRRSARRRPAEPHPDPGQLPRAR